MFFIKRSWLYVKRKLGKVITIGTILFVVSTLVLTGLIIKSASNNTFEVARDKLGASVSYTTDLSSVMKNNGGQRPTGGEGFSFSLPDDYTQITTKEIDYIASHSKYVKDYIISADLAGEAVDFNYYNPSSDTSSTTTTTDDSSRGFTMRNNANVNIIGVDTKDKDTTFNSDSNTLADGRYFTDDEVKNASNVVIIEQTIANLNSLKVGDSITIKRESRGMRLTTSTDTSSTTDSSTSTDVDIKYQIVGIYKTKNPTDVSNSDFRGAFNLTENTMYAPYTTVLSADLAGLTGDDLTAAKAKIATDGYTAQSVTFNLKDPKDINAFISEVKSMKGITTTYRSLNANDAAYEKMVGPIENVANTSGVLVIVVVLAGAFIIGLLSMLSIRDRKYELGVLLSLGESRIKIIGQLICEMLIVSIVSFGLAALVSSVTAQGVTNYLLNQEIAASKNQTNNNQNGFNFGNGGGMMFRVNRQDLAAMNVETIDKLTVKVNYIDLLEMFGIGIAIIVVGNVLQAAFVLKCKPKEILLER